ncbi:trace amine-associated receptor 13c-like [Triplophysa rosa]|uniref:Trace amine-associated receptor 13c n=1 Tax=Triplophysa rosa TaxID=992332 RepID=A0A9W7TNQ9_TRIRA|nr:trace amine-associated receptor 13c-like [Triplophysa rosa]KAI7800174.1 trace amine-associated receptor 13c [Triplophysa rosa]
MDLSQQEYDSTQFCFPALNNSCIKYTYSIFSQTVIYIILLSAMILTILGNSVVIISIAHFRQLQTPTNILVMSLALADLLVGVMFMPLSIVRSVTGCWYYGEAICLFHSSFDLFLTSVSIFHLIFIAIDRYQAVCHPLQYPTRVTIPVAWVMVLLSWSLAAFYSFGLVYSKANEEGMDEYFASIECIGSCSLYFNALWSALDTLFTFFVPCSVMIGLYSRIFVVAKKHARNIGDGNQPEHENTFKTSRRSERKAAKTLGVVVGAFILCWLPYFTCALIDPYLNFSTPLELFDVFDSIGYMNSTINPIIYGLFYPWFRKTLYIILTLRIFEPNSSDISVFTI